MKRILKRVHTKKVENFVKHVADQATDVRINRLQRR